MAVVLGWEIVTYEVIVPLSEFLPAADLEENQWLFWYSLLVAVRFWEGFSFTVAYNHFVDF